MSADKEAVKDIFAPSCQSFLELLQLQSAASFKVTPMATGVDGPHSVTDRSTVDTFFSHSGMLPHLSHKDMGVVWYCKIISSILTDKRTNEENGGQGNGQFSSRYTIAKIHEIMGF